MTVASIAERVAELLGVASDDAHALAATEAAWEFVKITESLDAAAEPTGALQAAGLTGFARAVYLDAIASRGAQVALGDSVADTVFTPEDPYRHWRHYFAPLATSWGVA